MDREQRPDILDYALIAVLIGIMLIGAVVMAAPAPEPAATDSNVCVLCMDVDQR